MCTEAEEGNRTINKIKPIISAAALTVSVFPAAVKKQHSRTRKPFIPGQRTSKTAAKEYSLYKYLCVLRKRGTLYEKLS